MVTVGDVLSTVISILIFITAYIWAVWPRKRKKMKIKYIQNLIQAEEKRLNDLVVMRIIKLPRAREMLVEYTARIHRELQS